MHLLQKLRFGSGRVSHQADVYVCASVSFTREGFLGSSKKLSQNTFFDDLMAEDGRSKTFDQIVKNLLSLGKPHKSSPLMIGKSGDLFQPIPILIQNTTRNNI